MIATLLVDLVRREMPEAAIASFAFRAVSPLFDTSDFNVCGAPDADGKHIRLWARNSGGGLAMEGVATLA
jgi:3-methylfumaryl-CoA hydratase